MNLDKVTLLGTSYKSKNPFLTALKMCMKVQFSKIKVLTTHDYEAIEGVEFIKLGNNDPIFDYRAWGFDELNKYIDTEFMLGFHPDGFILNPEAWTDEFYNYDYTGAWWNDSSANWIKEICGFWNMNFNRVGNGGFTLISKKLLNFLATDEYIIKEYYNNKIPSDIFICSYMYDYLRESGFKFAPKEIADKFSIECGTWKGSFGFHDFKTDLSNYLNK